MAAALALAGDASDAVGSGASRCDGGGRLRREKMARDFQGLCFVRMEGVGKGFSRSDTVL